ncbi:hypothetical protein MUB24_12200 [Lederbergia sp. NSJ-179]|uniref:hypothetical protein n=1 Tax=Lederbergia sp. NSJ-179 TaxID=2931402 RepID=UPI001FD18EC2|nr:hypothetical protein [Lederbergia sp. NSJ-179]MCJ7841643.1 hypothetical protein [Lederbergia sp. NSJ-179]
MIVSTFEVSSSNVLSTLDFADQPYMYPYYAHVPRYAYNVQPGNWALPNGQGVYSDRSPYNNENFLRGLW